MDKSYIFLKSPIGSGGEANIYAVRIRPELVAKVYKKPHGDYARKLAFMIANPPVDPLASSGRVSIAWATELVTDLGLVVGFLMPKLDTSKAKPIFQYYNPSERRKESPTFSYVSLIRTARNLARAVRSVHSRGYVIGDVNESNVLVADDAIVTLVDTDSFQVNDGTTVYRCTVGKPEYTPPELQGMSFRDVDRSVEHDLFGLGVLIYQLLMEGTHPFGGVFTGQGEAPELKDRIKSGHFPHGRRGVPYKPMPLAPSFQMLPVALQELFLFCFEQGHRHSAARPTADVWSKALGEAEDSLVKCGVNGQHFYSGHLGVCPWCERAAKLGGRDPFPALGAIRSGQHLKPAVIGKAVGKPILNTNPKSSNSINTNPIPRKSASTSSVNNSTSQSTNTSSSSSVKLTSQTNSLSNPNSTHNKLSFPSNISGTQQSQINSLHSPTVTNSQVSASLSSSRTNSTSIMVLILGAAILGSGLSAIQFLPATVTRKPEVSTIKSSTLSPPPSPETTNPSEKYPSPSPVETTSPIVSPSESPTETATSGQPASLTKVAGDYKVVLDPKVLADAEKDGVKSVTGKWTIKPEGTFEATLKAVSVKGEEQEIKTAGKITIEDGKVVSQVETVNGQVPPKSPPKQPYTLSSDGKELQADGQPVKLIRTTPLGL
ncbi:protein kinase (plasmid) [Pseudanabaena biceps]|nr:protein kinase [Pseudanabaena biceps]